MVIASNIVVEDQEMIDIATETVMTLGDAAKKVLVDQTTVFRWVTKGTKGIKLEAFRVGTRWRTSLEAPQLFIDARTPSHESAPVPRTQNQHRVKGRGNRSGSMNYSMRNWESASVLCARNRSKSPEGQ